MWSFLFLSLTTAPSEGASILALLPFDSRSHWIVMEPLLLELATRGHHVTAFTMFPQKTPHPNYTDVDLSDLRPSTISSYSLERIKKKMPNLWVTTLFYYEVTEFICEVIKEPPFQKLLKTTNQYDLVITEVFGNDCMAYFAHKLNTPMISLITLSSVPWASERFWIPDNPSYIPNVLVPFLPEMNLFERTYNTASLLYAKFWHLHVYAERSRMLAEKYMGGPMPPLGDVVANTSLLLVNSYLALAQSRPFPPNVVEIGGIHIRHKQPLPKDLANVLDEAEQGVIMMSLGSLVRASSLPKTVISNFMNVFGNISQKVILKYEEDLPEAPENVIVRKWLPQRDILEHENVIAIIAHGGLASTIEAVYFGKPLIGIPFFNDQFGNVRNVVARNAGLQLDVEDLTEEKISTAVGEITTNTKYREGMRRLSQQYRDRPLTALQSAVFWTEYVIRHKGAPHLQPASTKIPLYQYLLLDVLVVVLMTSAVVTFSLFFVLKRGLTFLKSKLTGHKRLLKKE